MGEGDPVKEAITRTDRAEWSAKAQEFEAAWWRDNFARLVDNPVAYSQAIMERWGFAQDKFFGLDVLDVGCGPTQRLSWLQGMRTLDALDPLGADYERLYPDAMRAYDVIYVAPVEDFVSMLYGRYDFVFCINCLDHCFDLARALENLRLYLRRGGRAMLSMDCDKWCDADETHPIMLSRDGFAQAVRAAGFRIERETVGDCRAPNDFPDAWGGGTAVHLEVLR
jgi:SAM-dependent methyltransferase